MPSHSKMFKLALAGGFQFAQGKIGYLAHQDDLPQIKQLKKEKLELLTEKANWKGEKMDLMTERVELMNKLADLNREKEESMKPKIDELTGEMEKLRKEKLKLLKEKLELLTENANCKGEKVDLNREKEESMKPQIEKLTREMEQLKKENEEWLNEKPELQSENRVWKEKIATVRMMEKEKLRNEFKREKEDLTNSHDGKIAEIDEEIDHLLFNIESVYKPMLTWSNIQPGFAKKMIAKQREAIRELRGNKRRLEAERDLAAKTRNPAELEDNAATRGQAASQTPSPRKTTHRILPPSMLRDRLGVTPRGRNLVL